MAAPLVVPAVAKHTATVIMAHGLGDTGKGWVDLARNWRSRGKFDYVQFVFPNAPMIPITVNMGLRMPGWYDIVRDRSELASQDFTDIQLTEDEPGILRSREQLTSLITAQTTPEVPASRIVIGGFSQGGAMALFTGVTSPVKLGGIFGMSCYMLMREKLQHLGKEMGNDENLKTPIWMGHGAEDSLVQTKWGEKTAQMLEEWGYGIEWKTYPGLGHSADPQEIEDLGAYLEKQIPPI